MGEDKTFVPLYSIPLPQGTEAVAGYEVENGKSRWVMRLRRRTDETSKREKDA
jgi:hypothetical protein